MTPRQVGSVVSVSASHGVGHGFASGHTKDHNNNGRNCLPAWHAGILGRSLAEQPYCIKIMVEGETVYRACFIKIFWDQSQSRVWYPSPGFLSNAAWP